MKKILPHKDRWSRGTILWLGLALLLLLNGLFYIITKQPEYILWYLLLVCLIGLMYWRKWSVYSKLHYLVDDEQIQILQWSKILKTIQRKDIKHIETNRHIWLRSAHSMLYQKFFPRGVYQYMDEYHARLALTGLTRIETEREVIWVSGSITT